MDPFTDLQMMKYRLDEAANPYDSDINIAVVVTVTSMRRDTMNVGRYTTKVKLKWGKGQFTAITCCMANSIFNSLVIFTCRALNQLSVHSFLWAPVLSNYN